MKRIVKAVLFLVLICSACSTYAMPVHWRGNVVDYSAEGKDVKDVLRDFAASQGIPANVSKDVAGAVTGKFHMAPQKFLDTLASSFGFVWYYDGQVLDIVTPDDMKNTLVKLDHASVGELRDTLASMGVTDPRFRITYDDAQSVAMVNGPPGYVQMVSDVATRLDANINHRSGTVIRVFALHHAWSTDRTVNIEGSSTTLAGVASVLNSMYHPNQSGASGQNSGANGNVGKMKSMTDVGGSRSGGGMSGGGTPPVPPGMQSTTSGQGLMAGLSGSVSPALAGVLGSNGNGAGSGGGAAGGGGDDLPVIQADQRTNSVLIRDTPDRMFQYPELIERLDVKPRLIEIEAHLLEIDDGALAQLGVDWTAHSSHLDIETGNGAQGQNTYNNGTINSNFGTTTLAGNTAVAASPVGGVLTAVLGDAGRYLMARISALEQTNAAKIDASPKVTTLDNIEADMDNQTQFFVPVSGYTSADLYSITTGVSLRVLPMVVEEDGRTQIKLDIAIQDGELSGQTVNNIPVITSSNINTSAFINEGQALLVAGYKVDNGTNNITGVPLLSKIPYVGNLFKYTQKNDSHMERLFLLTPRIIDL